MHPNARTPVGPVDGHAPDDLPVNAVTPSSGPYGLGGGVSSRLGWRVDHKAAFAAHGVDQAALNEQLHGRPRGGP